MWRVSAEATGVHRNRDAAPLYGLMLGGIGIALLVVALTSRQWTVIALMLALAAVVLRYALPTSATALDDGTVRFSWPLRRVDIGPDQLVTSRIRNNAISGEGALLLRTRGRARFAVAIGRYTDGAGLAAALANVIRRASGLPVDDRESSVCFLEAAGRRMT